MKRWIVVVAAIVCLLPGLASAASAGCKDRLKEVDAKLAEAKGLDPHLRSMLTTFRNQGAAHCETGEETSSGAAFTSVEMMLSGTQNATANRQRQAASKTASKSEITPAYMAGTWCMTTPTNNARELYVFDADGSYKSAPSEFRFAFVGRGSFEDFLASIPAISEQGPSRFVVEGRRADKTFERGTGICQGDGSPATP